MSSSTFTSTGSAYNDGFIRDYAKFIEAVNRPSDVATRHNVLIVADTIWDGERVITVAIDAPAAILPQISKNRLCAQSSESSRAINAEQNIQNVAERPFIPAVIGKNGKGMSPREMVDDSVVRQAIRQWVDNVMRACAHAKNLTRFGVHKEFTNRLVEIGMWKRQVLTATWSGWMHYFAQRLDGHAQGDHRLFAMAIAYAIANSTPVESLIHLPFITPEERESGASDITLALAATGRCGRVSYGREDVKNDLATDAERGRQYARDGHLSCLEHVHVWVGKEKGHPLLDGWMRWRDHVYPQQQLQKCDWDTIKAAMLADEEGISAFDCPNQIKLPAILQAEEGEK